MNLSGLFNDCCRGLAIYLEKQRKVVFDSLGKQKSGKARGRDITNDTTKLLGLCGSHHRTRATKRRRNADIVGREEDG